ncbi:DKNYY domain-containing protein [Flavobacterium hercynium]|uniref:DKNYY family protein n=1 Tax=Flavobacterium hercynium TaxID=387094 RepID=A0A226H5K5_9FLAO|nr:DKNYY domain-containing protein [Flavobacterium hercynium]OXA89513.1 hypothetical protein B0A66_13915 [Flavobacterium hercynium]SMP35854.1 DKNYY family protein [Flavobacterium hercynium]
MTHIIKMNKTVLYLLLLVLLISCKAQNKEIKLLSNNLYKDDKGNIIFRIRDLEGLKEEKGMTVKNDSLNFSHVYDSKTNTYIKNNEVIDWETFDNIFNDPKNVEKTKEKQNGITFYCYFSDKNNTYLYPFLSTRLLLIKGNDYEVLGGAYLKVNNEIYWKAKKLKSVDIETFKTVQLVNTADYHELSIGSDKDHLYGGNEIMSYKEFKDRYRTDEELERKYFKK